MTVSQNITSELQKLLLLKMMRIRIIEEELARLYSEQEMRCPVHFCIGQEATAVAVCSVLSSKDTVMSNHRSHGHYLAQGGDLKRMVAELYGKATGCASGKGGSMHILDLSASFMGSTSIVAGTIPVAVGIGFYNKLQNKKSISVVFLGDAATEEGLFYESLNFAVLHKLPVLFVCENNLYSVYSPLSVRQPPNRKIYELANVMGAKSSRLDGNDVEEVYFAALEAVNAIRSGHGPYLLEAMTYRWLEHCGPNFDNNIGYRDEKEFLEWKKRDPVQKISTKLIENNIISKEFMEIERNRILEEIQEAVKFAKESPFPDKSELTTNVYSK